MCRFDSGPNTANYKVRAYTHFTVICTQKGANNMDNNYNDGHGYRFDIPMGAKLDDPKDIEIRKLKKRIEELEKDNRLLALKAVSV